MVHSDSESENEEYKKVPVFGNGERYIVPRVLPAYAIHTSPDDPRHVVITLFNKVELETSKLEDCRQGSAMVGAVRLNNYFQYTLDGTENPHRTARVLARMNQARAEQLPLVEQFSEDVLADGAFHYVSAFSAYLNDLNMFPLLVDENRQPVWVDMYEFDKNGDMNDPQFVIDPVEIYGTWWNEAGRHFTGSSEDVVDLAPIPEAVPFTREAGASVRIMEDDDAAQRRLNLLQNPSIIIDLGADEEQEQEEEGAIDDDEEEAHIELRRKFKTIPTTLLKTLPDRVMVDAMTYAFMRSKGVISVQAVPVLTRPWVIGHINVTISKKGSTAFIKKIRKHEAEFCSALQVNVDMLHEKQKELAEKQASDPR